ncbi:MAG: putative signal transducing protein [Anaerolineales bacterium]
MNEQLVFVGEASGSFEGEILKTLLASRGIESVLSQESVGQVTGLVVGPMGSVRILVTEDHAQRARQILDEYYRDHRDAEG